MARLVYSAIASLDGYVNDATGGFGWAAPDEEVHAYVNQAEASIGTYLYGRRMYEVMKVWADLDLTGQHEVVIEFAQLWRAADKVVYSTTLDSVSTPRTRLERTFDPTAVRALVAAAERDVSVGGPTLAATAIQAGLVEEYRFTLVPAVVGGGTAMLPVGVRLDLALLDERRFRGGAVHLRYRPS